MNGWEGHLFSALMILSSLMLSSIGFALYIWGRYGNSSFAKQYYDYRPHLQAAYIVITYANCLLSFYHIVDGCDESWIISDWYCLGTSVDSSMFPIMRMITIAPLVLLIALHDTRVYLILFCNLIAFIVAFSIAFVEGKINFVAQLLIWGVVVMIIFVDVHLMRVDQFLQHRKLQVALHEIERIQAIDRETELRHMIGNVAHDLKTPLSSITTAIEMIGHIITKIEERLSLFSPIDLERFSCLVKAMGLIRSSLLGAHDTTNFMFMTINRCIDYTKASKGIKLTPKYETIHLLQTLNIPFDCMRNMQDKIQIKLNDISSDEICSHIITDKQWLQENILCLLSNAVKYSNDGIVSVSVSVKPFVVLEKELMKNKKKKNNDKKDLQTIAERSHLVRQTSSTNSRHRESSTFRKFSKILPINSNSNMRIVAEIDDEEAAVHTSHCVSTEFVSTSPASLTSSADPHELFVCCEVEDNGIGITDEDLMSSLFEPFKKAQRLAGGTGLGLYSLAKRMDAIKGYYGAHKRSDDKHGSVFWFAIPYRPDIMVAKFMNDITNANNNSNPTETAICPLLCSANNVSTPTKEEAEVVIPPPKKRNILLVDDSPTIIRMMSMMLTRQGNEVYIAENGMIALESIEKQQQSYDLILMDIQMPVMDGIEATKRIRLFEQQMQQQQQQKQQHYHPLVVIGMSANSDEETKNAALLAGVNEFISKPISMSICSQLMIKYSPSK